MDSDEARSRLPRLVFPLLLFHEIFVEVELRLHCGREYKYWYRLDLEPRLPPRHRSRGRTDVSVIPGI